MSVSQILLPNGSPSQSVIAYGSGALANVAGVATLALQIAGASATSTIVAFPRTATAGALSGTVAANAATIVSGNVADVGIVVNWILLR